MTKMLLQLAVALAILLVAFRLLDGLRPRTRRLPVWRRGFVTDCVYWFFTPIVTRAITRVLTIAAVVPVALLAYGKVDADLIRNGFGPAARLPLWVQAIAILLLGDFLGYWMHRAFHQGWLWRFHSVHHSSVDLDWLSSVRLHPVNDVLMRIATTLPVLALGFAPLAVAGLIPFLTAMAVLVHANVDWDWGPLRGWVASPCFHRWHHTDESAARDKNFAGMFPFWDRLFGTYYMPHDARPARFGTSTPVPSHLLGQLLFPFRADKAWPALRAGGSGRRPKPIDIRAHGQEG
mgnify:CR=1 FL=1